MFIKRDKDFQRLRSLSEEERRSGLLGDGDWVKPGEGQEQNSGRELTEKLMKKKGQRRVRGWRRPAGGARWAGWVDFRVSSCLWTPSCYPCFVFLAAEGFFGGALSAKEKTLPSIRPVAGVELN